MKVLVTGASGFIGNYLVKELLKNNHQVIATSQDEEKAKTFSWVNNVKYIPLNLSRVDDSINYFNYFDNPEAIIHLAWKGLPNYDALFHFEENLFRHYGFLKNLVRNGVKDITVTGTCFEYGLQEGKLSENMAAIPANPYAIAKDSLRKFLEQLQKHLPFSLKWVRLFYMYGEGQNPNSLLAQLESAIKNGEKEFNMSAGEQQRDYLPVEKMVEYIAQIALQKKVEGVINCCSGVPITVNQLVDNFLSEKKQSIKLNKGFYSYQAHEPMNFWGDDKKLKDIIKR
ncbi:MAG TPA: NAD-dependent epimerase/dehydratase family protein [Hanamia sp.]|nr:NAD-dependent epimerase/dehydratase family protein [Hanamia sp.]